MHINIPLTIKSRWSLFFSMTASADVGEAAYTNTLIRAMLLLYGPLFLHCFLRFMSEPSKFFCDWLWLELDIDCQFSPYYTTQASTLFSIFLNVKHFYDK